MSCLTTTHELSMQLTSNITWQLDVSNEIVTCSYCQLASTKSRWGQTIGWRWYHRDRGQWILLFMTILCYIPKCILLWKKTYKNIIQLTKVRLRHFRDTGRKWAFLIHPIEPTCWRQRLNYTVQMLPPPTYIATVVGILGRWHLIVYMKVLET